MKNEGAEKIRIFKRNNFIKNPDKGGKPAENQNSTKKKYWQEKEDQLARRLQFLRQGEFLKQRPFNKGVTHN